MKTELRPWWKKRRVLLPAALLLLIAAALAVAILRSDRSQLVIYNDTGAALGPLTVTACGEQWLFPQIEDEASVSLRPSRRGEPGAVELSMPTEPAWHWEGSYLEARGGYLVFIHLRRGMEVETHTQISFWQQLLFGRAAGE